MLKLLRKSLDALYLAGGALSALFLIAILIIIVLQMMARWFGFVFPGSTAYAGYCMAGASFMALAYALNHGAHIRVNLLLTALGPYRRWGEIWCFGVGAGLATFFARYAIKANIWSAKLHDISQGQDATPMWIPQIVMSMGTVLVAVALWDNFFRVLVSGETNIRSEGVGEA